MGSCRWLRTVSERSHYVRCVHSARDRSGFSVSGADICSGLGAEMPKPGPWMVALKQFTSLPLFLTSVWLIWVYGRAQRWSARRQRRPHRSASGRTRYPRGRWLDLGPVANSPVGLCCCCRHDRPCSNDPFKRRTVRSAAMEAVFCGRSASRHNPGKTSFRRLYGRMVSFLPGQRKGRARR